MVKQAAIRSSSTTSLQVRCHLLILLVALSSLGCRGPWFKKADNFDPIVVKEKQDVAIPRAFASSRLRPSKGVTSAPQPNRKSQTISDDSDEAEAVEGLAPEHQELFKKQLAAIKTMRSMSAEAEASTESNEDDTSFSMSDEEAPANSAESESTPSSNVTTVAAAKPNQEGSSQPVASTTEHPLSREGQRKTASQTESQAAATRESGTSPKASLANATLPNASGAAKPTTAANKVVPITQVQPAVANPTKTESNPVAQASASKSSSAGVSASMSDNDATKPPTSPDTQAPQGNWTELAHAAIADLDNKIKNSTTLSPDQKFALAAKKRMLSLVVDDLESAMEPIDGLKPHEQDYFVHQFQALHAATDPKGNPVFNRRWTLALQSQRKAQMHLASVSNLEIQNAAFCTEVDSFGIISKFPQYHFRADQELLLYCELDNFVSEPVKDGFETQLQGSYEIVDSNGRRVADQLLPMDEHVCRNQRRDYFIAYRMYMPQEIKPGRYTLKLTIEDMKGRKFGQTAVDFQVIQ